MAAAAGISLTWADLAQLSSVVPLMARVYPNGKADVNHFNAAGGMGFLIRELLGAGLLHEDVQTIMGTGLSGYTKEAKLGADGELAYADAVHRSADEKVLRPSSDAFQPTGGLNVLTGNLGTSVIKTSSIPADRHAITAPARVFHSQEELHKAFRSGELNRDVVAVVRFRHCARLAGPHAVVAPPLGENERLFPTRQLHGQPAVRVQHEGAAVEDEFVLAAHLIEIGQGQAGFYDSRDRDVQPVIALGGIEGRSVRHQQKLRARLAQALDRIGAPDVLADRHADAHAAYVERPRHGTGREQALLVEHAVIGQIDLEPHRPRGLRGCLIWDVAGAENDSQWLPLCSLREG